MSYYQDVYCHICGQQVCQACGCCHNPHCEHCSCPEIKKEINSEKSNNGKALKLENIKH